MNKLEALKQLEAGVRAITASRARRLMTDYFPIIWSRILRWNGKTQIRPVSTFWGGSFDAVIPEPISTKIWRVGYFDEPVCRSMLCCVEPGDTVLDIGSHFGFFTLLASAIAGETGRVVAIEATKSTFNHMSTNVRNNAAFANVTPFWMAAGDENGMLEFNDYGLIFSSLNSAFGARGPNKKAAEAQKEVISVPMRKLDEVLNEEDIQRVDFIKIDTESSEHLVLKGLTGILERDHPIISLEVSDASEEEKMHTFRIFEILEQFGYQAYRFEGNAIHAFEKGQPIGYDNFLFATADNHRVRAC